MNMRGNLISVESIMIFEGLSVGGAESSTPSAEKQKAPTRVMTIIVPVMMWNPTTTAPMARITREIASPNKKDATISPRMIPHRLMGVDTRRSRVLIRVSQGVITGPTAEVVKKRVMPSNPGSKNSTERSLPMEKATNKKEGISNPNMMVGPFKK
jgi:hypothetical protein